MRRVIHRTRTDDDDADRGAVLVWVGFLLTVLLGVGAVVIDVGALYVERRELQNGADAGALAVAKDCAEGDCGRESDTADDLADDNANDDQANVDRVCGEGPGLDRLGCAEPTGIENASGWVRVETSTFNPGNTENETQVGFLLAPFIGAASGDTVRANATAAWGPVASMETVPLAISTCALTDGGGPPPPGELPAGSARLFFHGGRDEQSDAEDCSFESLPWSDRNGGFGWLGGAEDCARDVDVGERLAGGPTSADPDVIGLECDPRAWRDRVVILPVYDSAVDLVGPTEYRIAGFVGFRITAYELGEHEWREWECGWWWGLFDWPCIEGEFTPITTAATTSGGFGTGPDYGVRVVRTIG